MRLILGILVCLLLVAGMVVWTSVTPLPDYAAGTAHPDIPAMSYGGDMTARSLPILFPAWAWQVFVIICMALLILLAVPERRRKTGFVLGVGATCLAMIAVWSVLMLTYKGVIDSGETAYVFGFPVTSSWMIFGTWASQGGFALLYVLGFRKYIFTAEDEAAFQALVARTSSQAE